VQGPSGIRLEARSERRRDASPGLINRSLHQFAPCYFLVPTVRRAEPEGSGGICQEVRKKHFFASFGPVKSAATAIEHSLTAAGMSLVIIAAFNGPGSTPITQFLSINTSGGRTFSVLSGITLTNPSALKRTGFSFLRIDERT
jgi:Flp pilus assembly pilin Flp